MAHKRKCRTTPNQVEISATSRPIVRDGWNGNFVDIVEFKQVGGVANVDNLEVDQMLTLNAMSGGRVYSCPLRLHDYYGDEGRYVANDCRGCHPFKIRRAPSRWPYDDGTRREAVLDADHKPPRVVRRVGWRSCMVCGSPFFSDDMVALRLCDGPSGCRAPRPR